SPARTAAGSPAWPSTCSSYRRSASIASRRRTSRSITSCGIWSTWPSAKMTFSSCPLPLSDGDRILLGHGSGGKMTAELLARCFLPAFRNEILDKRDDQAVVAIDGVRLAFTTDAYVVTPLFFPGGDLGDLAVNGTV